MISSLSIVMYHYVRNVGQTPYPGIKARLVDEFIRQLEHLRENYHVISHDEFKAAINDTIDLPENSALLTFDDGYIDHYTTVFPLLKKFGFGGIFAPVAQAAKRKKVLDVNKIHFVLSVAESHIDTLIGDIFQLIDEHRDQYKLEDNKSYYERLARPNRFDTAQVIFVKRILQRDLPEELRGKIADVLFQKYVSKDEFGFADYLYMNEEQLREMSEAGMGIIGHGCEHIWMNSIGKEKQEAEVSETKSFLTEITGETDGLIFCYPYGAHNDSLLDILRNNGFIAGFSTEPGVASQEHNPMLLPRLDTNDLPI